MRGCGGERGEGSSISRERCRSLSIFLWVCMLQGWALQLRVARTRFAATQGLVAGPSLMTTYRQRGEVACTTTLRGRPAWMERRLEHIDGKSADVGKKTQGETSSRINHRGQVLEKNTRRQSWEAAFKGIPGVTLQQLGQTAIAKAGLGHTNQKRQAHVLSVGSTQALVIGPVGPLANSGDVDKKVWIGVCTAAFILTNWLWTSQMQRRRLPVALTDCSSPHGSSACTASVCLPQTLEASGRRHTLRWGYSGPAASARKTNSSKNG